MTGWVYFAHLAGHSPIKIGHAFDVHSRLRALSVLGAYLTANAKAGGFRLGDSMTEAEIKTILREHGLCGYVDGPTGQRRACVLEHEHDNRQHDQPWWVEDSGMFGWIVTDGNRKFRVMGTSDSANDADDASWLADTLSKLSTDGASSITRAQSSAIKYVDAIITTECAQDLCELEDGNIAALRRMRSSPVEGRRWSNHYLPEVLGDNRTSMEGSVPVRLAPRGAQ